MDPVQLLLFVGGGALSGLGGWLALGHAATKARIAALIRETRTSPIRALRPGSLVEVQGRVRAEGHVLTAPLSGRPCVYFAFSVEEAQQRTSGTGKNRRTRTVWVNRVRDAQRRPFLLDDGTGTVRIDLERAEVGLAVDEGGGSGFLNDPTPAFENALRRYGVASQGWVFNKKLRYRETVLCEGDPLYALGTFSGATVTRGREDVLVVTDRGEAYVQSLYDGQATTARVGGYLLCALAVALPIIGLMAMMQR